MTNVNRNSFGDAKKHISRLLKIHDSGNDVAAFLCEKIKFANKINSHNWNLNLALNGDFLRFNVGQEYCIQIREHEILVLCLKDVLPIEIRQHSDYFFRGYRGREKIDTRNFDETPQCLAKVPNSIGVVFKENIAKWVSCISSSNSAFIEYAASNTQILPQMIKSHSVGATGFLSQLLNDEIPNPSFCYSAIIDNYERTSREIRGISNERLSELAQSHDSIPRKIETITTVFLRNPYVAEQAKRIAGEKCQDCGSPAPFIKKRTNEPFLEVHHKVPLSQGGKDVLDNVVALCPNCHRKRHYGHGT